MGLGRKGHWVVRGQGQTAPAEKLLSGISTRESLPSISWKISMLSESQIPRPISWEIGTTGKGITVLLWEVKLKNEQRDTTDLEWPRKRSTDKQDQEMWTREFREAFPGAAPETLQRCHSAPVCGLQLSLHCKYVFMVLFTVRSSHKVNISNHTFMRYFMQILSVVFQEITFGSKISPLVGVFELWFLCNALNLAGLDLNVRLFKNYSVMFAGLLQCLDVC